MKRIIQKSIAAATLLGALCLTNGCGYSDGDHFWVSRNGAEMPVWVRGNVDSGVFVIFNHGGPGSSGLLEVYLEAAPGDGSIDEVSPMRSLEEDYAVVYWDQRHQGNAQGNANPDETTWEDFAADLELVVDVLDERHDVDDLFVLGQSWGHSVGTMYMTLGDRWETRQSKLTGYIGYKGNISALQAYEYARPPALDIAEQKVDDGEDPELWDECLDFWSTHETLESSMDFMWHSWCAENAMDGAVPFGQRIGTSVAFTFVSPHNGWYHWANNRTTTGSSFMDRVVLESPLPDTAHRVRLPTLMIQGGNDLIAPPEVGEWYVDTIETPDADKELVILEESAHGAMGDDVEIFLDSIGDFVETYRTGP